MKEEKIPTPNYFVIWLVGLLLYAGIYDNKGPQ